MNPAHLLLTDPDGTGTDALLGVFTYKNNTSTSHLPALAVDYRGYTSFGTYFAGTGTPAHVYISNPNLSGLTEASGHNKKAELRPYASLTEQFNSLFCSR